MKCRGFIVGAAALMAATQVSAQSFDLKTMKCDKFVASDAQTIGRIATWLDGWYAGDNDPIVVNPSEIAKEASELRAYCTKNPTHTVLQAAEEVFE